MVELEGGIAIAERPTAPQEPSAPAPAARAARPAPVSPARSPSAAAGGKHVVILVENLPVPFDRRPWQIAQALVNTGHRVSIICPQMYEHTAAFERLSGVDIYRYPNREAATKAGWVREYLNAIVWMLWFCLKLFFTRGIDAIHACNPPDLLFLVAWPFKVFCGTRLMFDHHDLNPEVYLAKFGRRDRIYNAMCLFERMTYELADVALATNESFRRLATTRNRMPEDRVFVVRNAPMPGRFVRGDAQEELRFGHKHLVLYLGVMNKQDGLDLLLESAQHVVHTRGRRDVAFALIGDGPELPLLIDRAKEIELNGQLHFLGRISDGRALSQYLNTADICVCPDPKNDMNDHSTMTKVVEYLAMGKPVVAYDLHETRCTAADTALYAMHNDPVQFGDLIVKLLDDADLRQTLGQRGRERYDRQLSWKRSQEQLLAAYDRLFSLD